MSTAWLDRTQLAAWIRLVAVVELLPGVLDAQLRRDADVTSYDYYVLAMLSEAPERTLRMTELARRTNATLPRLSHVVRRLEERGLVERYPCPEDRRATNARLTEGGWTAVEAAAPGHVATVRAHVIDALTPEQVAQLTAIGREFGLRAHVDGARIANAVAALGCSPADVTWRAGVDVLSLGATKNGALSAEAIVAFDDRVADELVYRTKRSGHVTSKMRFQSAQLAAYLTDGLWLRLATNSNQRMAELVAELQSLAPYGVRLQERVDVNMAFVELPAPAIDAAADAGVLFYRMGPTAVRLVTSWQTTAGDVTEAGRRFREAVQRQAQ